MKKLLFTVFIFLFVLNANAQLKVILNDGTTLSLPEGTRIFEDTLHDQQMRKTIGNDLTKKLSENTQTYTNGNLIYRVKPVQKITDDYIRKTTASWKSTYEDPSNRKLYKDFSFKTMKRLEADILRAQYLDSDGKLVNRIAIYDIKAKKAVICEILSLNKNQTLLDDSFALIVSSIRFN